MMELHGCPDQSGPRASGALRTTARLRAILELIPPALAIIAMGCAFTQGIAKAQTIRQDLYVTNGEVHAVAVSGGTLYIGGTFTEVGPATGGGVPIDSTTGAPLAGYPKVAGFVYTVAPDGSGGWYIGGWFSAVGGTPRSNLAHVLSDFTVSSWDPKPNSTVWALAVKGATVYAGGEFTSVGLQGRNYVAALDAVTGLPTGWNPNANNTVRALAVGGDTIYAGGEFTKIGGGTRYYIAALDGATGAATSWQPDADDVVNALLVDGSKVYAAGQFYSIGRQDRPRLAALDALTGLATTWNPNADAYVDAIALQGSTMYAGGEFTRIGGQNRNYIAAVDVSTGLATDWNPDAGGYVQSLSVVGSTIYAGGQFRAIGGQARNYIAALDTATGLAMDWNPNANYPVFSLSAGGSIIYAGGWITSMGGRARNNIAALDISTGKETDWDPNSNGPVWALAVDGSNIYVGGDFTTIGGQPRDKIAALDAATGFATSWNPNAANSGVTYSVRVLALSGSIVYVAGAFTGIGGQLRNGLAALATSSGMATSWNPGPNGDVYCILVRGSTIYIGGWFTYVAGQPRNHLAQLYATTGSPTPWDPNVNNWVTALAANQSTIYAGGVFTSIGVQARTWIAAIDSSSGLPTEWNPGAACTTGPFGYVHTLAVDGSTVYAGGTFTSIGGQPRNNIAALDPSTGLARGWIADAEARVNAIALDGSTVYAAGLFSSIGNQPQQGVAAITETPTSVALATLDAVAEVDRVRLRWHASGDAIVLTSVYRRTPDTEWVLLAHPLVDGAHEISYEDATVLPGTRYGYRLVVRDITGAESSAETWVSVPGEAGAPAVLRLEPVRPNPIGGRAELGYGLPRAGRVRLVVYDLQGRRVATVVDRVEAAGWHSATWDGRDAWGRTVASGAYFARLEAAGAVQVRKLVVAR